MYIHTRNKIIYEYIDLAEGNINQENDDNNTIIGLKYKR